MVVDRISYRYCNGWEHLNSGRKWSVAHYVYLRSRGSPSVNQVLLDAELRLTFLAFKISYEDIWRGIQSSRESILSFVKRICWSIILLCSGRSLVQGALRQSWMPLSPQRRAITSPGLLLRSRGISYSLWLFLVHTSSLLVIELQRFWTRSCSILSEQAVSQRKYEQSKESWLAFHAEIICRVWDLLETSTVRSQTHFRWKPKSVYRSLFSMRLVVKRCISLSSFSRYQNVRVVIRGWLQLTQDYRLVHVNALLAS